MSEAINLRLKLYLRVFRCLSENIDCSEIILSIEYLGAKCLEAINLRLKPYIRVSVLCLRLYISSKPDYM